VRLAYTTETAIDANSLEEQKSNVRGAAAPQSP
jgi:hypothetical protein